MLVHTVYFNLYDTSEKTRSELIADCYGMLKNLPGVEFFSAGIPSDIARPVSDRDYDVALMLAFTDRAAHDLYAEHPDHVTFKEKHAPNWKRVRIFDFIS